MLAHRCQGRVVIAAAGNGLFENTRIAGETSQALIGDHPGELPGAELTALNMVVPDALSKLWVRAVFNEL